MKKVLSLVFAALVLLGAFPLVSSADGDPVTINVYNWGQYIGVGEDGTIDVNKAFTEATGIQVNYVTYDSNEAMYTKLELGGANYDIVIPSDYMIARMIENDMLEKLDFSNIPNAQHVAEEFRNLPFDPTGEYSLPYTYGAVGIVYNTKYVDEEDIGSWDLLWNEKYKGKILMINNSRDAFGIAEFLNGDDINSSDSEVLNRAYEKLKEQKPLVKKNVMDEVFSMMQNEEAWIAPYYVGDFLTMKQENEALEFYYPEEGFNYFFDSICIPKGAKHKKEAEAYINFLCSPEISGANMDAIGYSSPITGNTAYMSEEFAALVEAYADAEQMKQGKIFSNLPDETLQYMDRLWSELKTSSLNNVLLWCICGVVVVAVAVLIFWFGKKKKKKKDLYYE